jgi:hypothetical protein
MPYGYIKARVNGQKAGGRHVSGRSCIYFNNLQLQTVTSTQFPAHDS